MGRFETLNPDTQDQVEAMLPAIAKAFKIDDVKDIIPEDIRMRAWDCERRDHIKDQTEDEPRNWGVQFLRDLQAIARLTKGDIPRLQADLRRKVEKHADNHPWCRLQDIKDLKKKYMSPDVPSEEEPDPEEYVTEYASSPDSYFEELVEQEVPKGMRRPRNHEAYEVRPQPSQKKREKSSRLRRDSEGWERRQKTNRHSVFHSVEDGSSIHGNFTAANPTSRAGSSMINFEGFPSYYQPDVPLESQKLQAELEVAEAELNYARLKVKFFDAKKREESALQGSADQYDSRPSYLG
ncbi:unnamed protein product [Periconia digitata]|uniref:Uncharacterized protein n=1 Tax=Periconia digitata TaxID=1303443 RepID=A0A9W4UTQ5_9PLEO|nr:unnamed protein product [Periconia digitata]